MVQDKSTESAEDRRKRQYAKFVGVPRVTAHRDGMQISEDDGPTAFVVLSGNPAELRQLSAELRFAASWIDDHATETEANLDARSRDAVVAKLQETALAAAVTGAVAETQEVPA